MDNKDYIRVLLYSYYTTITGWGVLLKYIDGLLVLRLKFEHLLNIQRHVSDPYRELAGCESVHGGIEKTNGNCFY